MKTIVAHMLLLASASCVSAGDAVRVLVWDEQQPEQHQAYGDHFLGETIAAHLNTLPGISAVSVALSSPDQGLDEQALDHCDVLVMWEHKRHNEVTDEHVERVVSRVLAGKLGVLALHSAHWSKTFIRLMQERAKADALAQIPAAERAGVHWTYLAEKPLGQGVKADTPLTPSLEKTADGYSLTLPRCIFPAWRADGASSHITTLLADHPLAHGLPATWDVPHTEMYGGPFHVPKPDAVVFSERWDKGESFAFSGATWQVGMGRVVYFRPGHETFPVFKQAEPLQVVENAVRWLGTH